MSNSTLDSQLLAARAEAMMVAVGVIRALESDGFGAAAFRLEFALNGRGPRLIDGSIDYYFNSVTSSQRFLTHQSTLLTKEEIDAVRNFILTTVNYLNRHSHLTSTHTGKPDSLGLQFYDAGNPRARNCTMIVADLERRKLIPEAEILKAFIDIHSIENEDLPVWEKRLDDFRNFVAVHEKYFLKAERENLAALEDIYVKYIHLLRQGLLHPAQDQVIFFEQLEGLLKATWESFRATKNEKINSKIYLILDPLMNTITRVDRTIYCQISQTLREVIFNIQTLSVDEKNKLEQIAELLQKNA